MFHGFTGSRCISMCKSVSKQGVYSSIPAIYIYPPTPAASRGRASEEHLQAARGEKIARKRERTRSGWWCMLELRHVGTEARSGREWAAGPMHHAGQETRPAGLDRNKAGRPLVFL